MKKVIIITVFLLILTATLSGCAWIKRLGKDIKSDAAGGLERTLTVYTADGTVMKTYSGKIDLEPIEGGVVKFDLNGQRIMYYNCYVEVIESEGE